MKSLNLKAGNLYKITYYDYWISKDLENPVDVYVVGTYVDTRQYGCPGGNFIYKIQLLINEKIAEIVEDRIVAIELLADGELDSGWEKECLTM